MHTHQETLQLSTPGRGAIDITDRIAAIVRHSGVHTGIVSVFCQHTSCSLMLMENADPTARHDLEAWLARLAPDGDPSYTHDSEGPDDMSAHLRMVMTRTQETMPVGHGALRLGTWQGLFLYEHRTSPHRRQLVITVMGT